ncbi:MAG: CHAP domain-containing protein [Gaiellales bacterium]
MTYTAAEAARIAKGQVGYRESGTNKTKFNDWLGRIPGYPHGGFGYPWCMSFQSWVADMAGGKANDDYPKTAGCEVAVAWFKKHKRWSTTPHVGDMVFYGPGGGTHVELVVAVSKTSITTVGGNTSGSLNGAFHNGDGVYQKAVSRSSSRIYGYGRPVYAAASKEDDDMQPNTRFEINDYWKGKGEFSHEEYDAGFLWTGAVSETRTYGKKILAQIQAQNETIKQLSAAVAALSTGQQVDPDELVRRIEAALEKVTVRIDVDDSV